MNYVDDTYNMADKLLWGGLFNYINIIWLLNGQDFLLTTQHQLDVQGIYIPCLTW